MTIKVKETMTQSDEPRDAELRINEQDRAAIKEARDKCFGPHTPMGYVARVACERMVAEAMSASNVKL